MRLVAATLAGLLALVASGPAPSSKPTVTGVLQVGSRLTASPGSWSGAGTIAYTYQWYRCDQLGGHCSSIHGATSGTYREVPKDAGHALALTVRAEDGAGAATAYAPLAGVVAAATAASAPAAQPALTGDAIVGQPLTVAAPSYTTPLTGTPGYAWARCNGNGRACRLIAGADASAYTPVADDAGHVLIATVTVARHTVLSTASAVVRAQPGPAPVARPTVTGLLRLGGKLTASPGTWTGSGTITYAYQWYRCDQSASHCSFIRGATRGTYTEVAADVGRTIGLTVRATDRTGTTAAYAAVAGTVAAAGGLAATAQPVLTGTATVGKALTVRQGGWTSTPASVAYTWLRCNANGRVCAAIPGATAPSYTLTADDAGHTLVAGVTATAGTSSILVLAVASAVVGS